MTRAQVVRDLAVDLQHALARKGRAPFVLSGLPMFEDLCALQQTLAQCLALGEEPHLRHWYTVLHDSLPTYTAAFAQVSQAVDWVAAIKRILDVPPPTVAQPGRGGDAVALALAHYLGRLADRDDLSPWLKDVRNTLLAVSERYWAGLFPCYDIVGLPRTNNAHERLYGQLKRQLRRQVGVRALRAPLLRRGAWALLQSNATSPAELRAQLAQVSWEDYAAERARFERHQDRLRQRYRWRHQRDAVLHQRLADWTEVVSTC